MDYIYDVLLKGVTWWRIYLRFILNKIVLFIMYYATVAKILIKNSWNFTWISSSPIAKLSLMCQRKTPVNHSLVTKCLELQRQELGILTFEIFSLKTFHNYRSRTSNYTILPQRQVLWKKTVSFLIGSIFRLSFLKLKWYIHHIQPLNENEICKVSNPKTW